MQSARAHAIINAEVRHMGKLIKWIEAVIANRNPYATMAGVDIKKSAEQLFEDGGQGSETADAPKGGEDDAT